MGIRPLYGCCVCVTILTVAWVMGGCSVAPISEKTTLLNSSLDRNDHAPHRLKVENREYDDVVFQVKNMIAERKLHVRSEKCGADSCELVVYTRSNDAELVGRYRPPQTERLRVPAQKEGETTVSPEPAVQKHSGYWLHVRRDAKSQVVLEMAGVPVVDQVTSCPNDLKDKLGCEEGRLHREMGRTLAATWADREAIDVSGEEEARFIRIFLEQLR